MKQHRVQHRLNLPGAAFFLISLFLLSSCNPPWRPKPPSPEELRLEYGRKVGTLARTIKSSTLYIQSELGKPQPNLHEMQEAQARVLNAHLEQLPRVPEGLGELHDSWIGASFYCQYDTSLAVINMHGDLSACLSKIDAVIRATAQYMPAQEGRIDPAP